MQLAKVVSREEWGALPTRDDIEPLNEPLDTVYITLNTETTTCDCQEACTNVVREIQQRHMNTEGKPDIAHNFLVGSDGNIYEGRGWNLKPAIANEDPKFSKATLDIAYIGNYPDEKSLPFKDYGTACDILLEAIDKKFLSYGGFKVIFSNEKDVDSFM